MNRIVKTIGLVALTFICLPTVIVLVASFSTGKNLKFPPTSPGISAYVDLLSDPDMRTGLYRSLLLGFLTVAFAAIPGILAGLALFKHRVRFRTALLAFLTLGFSVPLVVSGVAFLILYTKIGAVGHLWPIAVAIAALNFPILLFCVASSVVNLDDDLENAAATLGAEKVQTFLFVTLPTIVPGILTGLIMMFVLGLTEFLVTLINSTVDTQTMPIVMFSTLRGAVSPELAAGGAVFILIAFIVVLLISRLRQVEDLLFRSDAGRQ
jgi:putative spermidine/putrescine transport system permease protein